MKYLLTITILIILIVNTTQAVIRPNTLYGILEHIEDYFDYQNNIDNIPKPCVLEDLYTTNSLPFGFRDNLYFKDNIEINSSHFYTATLNELGTYGGEIRNSNNKVTIVGCRSCSQLSSNNTEALRDEIKYEISDDDYFEIGDVDFRADKKIVLTPGFKVEKGAYFRAYITPKFKENYHDNFENYSIGQRGDKNEHGNLGDLGAKWFVTGQNKYPAPSEHFVEYKGGIKTIRSAKALKIESTHYNPSTNLYDYNIQGNKDLIVGIVTSNDTIFYCEIASKFQNHTDKEPYGRYDGLAKSSVNPYTNNAIWLWSRNGIAEANEIDILETISDHCDTYYNTGIILYNGPDASGINNVQSHMYKSVARSTDTSDFSLNADYHLYSYEHYKDKLIFLFDNVVVARYPNNYIKRRYDLSAQMLREPFLWILGIVHGGWKWEELPEPQKYTSVNGAELRIKYIKASTIIEN